jgi:hypothetical protein
MDAEAVLGMVPVEDKVEQFDEVCAGYVAGWHGLSRGKAVSVAGTSAALPVVSLHLGVHVKPKTAIKNIREKVFPPLSRSSSRSGSRRTTLLRRPPAARCGVGRRT